MNKFYVVRFCYDGKQSEDCDTLFPNSNEQCPNGTIVNIHKNSHFVHVHSVIDLVFLLRTQLMVVK